MFKYKNNLYLNIILKDLPFIFKYIFYVIKKDIFLEDRNCNFSKKIFFMPFLIIFLLLKNFTQTFSKTLKDLFY